MTFRLCLSLGFFLFPPGFCRRVLGCAVGMSWCVHGVVRVTWLWTDEKVGSGPRLSPTVLSAWVLHKTCEA